MMASTRTKSQAIGLLASAHALHSELSTTPPGRALNGEIIFQVEAELEDVPSLVCLPENSRQEFDAIGTSLWNTCGRLASTRFANREDRKVLSRAKTIAFILIDAIAPNGISGNLRSLKAALLTARLCIENKQLKLALRILESGAQRLDSLKGSGAMIEESRLQDFSAEYFTLRAHLAWLRCRPDLADHLFSQVPPDICIASRKIVVEMCYKVGCLAMAKHQHGEAAKWLNRAIDAMPRPEEGILTQDTESNNMSLLVRHTLARVCLNMNTSESGNELAKQLEVLKREHKEVLAVKFLELQVILDGANRGLETDTNAFFEALEKITSSVQLTRETFLSIYAFVKLSQCLSQELSLKALHSVLVHLPIEDCNLVESAFIKLIAFAVGSQTSEESRLACIRVTANSLEARGMKPLSATVAHACLIFIWKHVDQAFRCDQYSTAGDWCQLVLDTGIFRECSEQNMLTIRKKLALCALKEHNPALAHEALDGVPPLNSLNPEEIPMLDLQVLYLKFRLSVQEGQGASAISDYMPSLSPEDENPYPYPFQTYFFQMCALEAQLHDNPQDGIAWVQMFLAEGADQTSDIEGLVFSLFLLTAELERGPPAEPNVVLMLKLLRLAVPIACRPTDEGDSLSDEYLEWICRASYTLAHDLLKAYQTVHIEEALSIAQELFFQLRGRPWLEMESIELFRLRITYLVVTWHILNVRSENCNEVEKRARYRAISKQFDDVQDLRTRSPGQIVDIYRNLWALGVEAAIFNEEWIKVLFYFQDCLWILNQTMFSQFVESILTLDMPQGYRVYILQKTVRCLFGPHLADTSPRHLLPFYLRVIFELCLAAENPDECVKNVFRDDEDDDHPEDKDSTFLTIAELILDQATLTATDEAYVTSDGHCKMHVEHTDIGRRNSKCGQFPYPKDELVHLAIIAFNQAVDFYSQERDVECRRWARKAIGLAELAGGAEGTQLGTDLRRRLAALF